MKERERKGKEKNCHWSFVLPWQLICVGLPCRGSQDASDAASEGDQKPSKGTACANYFFLFIERLEHPWINMIVGKKTNVKNRKCPMTLGKKKRWPLGLFNNNIVHKIWKLKNIPRTLAVMFLFFFPHNYTMQ